MKIFKNVGLIILIFITLLLFSCANNKIEEKKVDNVNIDDKVKNYFTGFYELNDDATMLTVKLDGNSTTGYTWNNNIFGEDKIKLVNSDYVVNESDGNMVGVGGTYIATFAPTLTNDGFADILFMYKRNFEEHPIQIRQITVKVENGKILVKNRDNIKEFKDGTYDVYMEAKDFMNDGGVIKGFVSTYKKVILTEDYVNSLKVGDVIDIKKYDEEKFNIEVTEITKKGDEIVINEGDTLVKGENGYNIKTFDDDYIEYDDEVGFVTFSDNYMIDDEMSKIAYNGEKKYDNIYDFLMEYMASKATIVIKNGLITNIKTYYHP